MIIKHLEEFAERNDLDLIYEDKVETMCRCRLYKMKLNSLEKDDIIEYDGRDDGSFRSVRINRSKDNRILVFDMIFERNLDNSSIEIMSINVHKDYRNKGIFKNMLTIIEDFYDNIQFSIVCNNLAHSILTKYGYEFNNGSNSIFQNHSIKLSAGELSYRYADKDFIPKDLFKKIER